MKDKRPKKSWAIFSGEGTNISIQELEKRIITEWLPTSGYEYGNAPDIEVYINPNPANAKFEVWIPVIRSDNYYKSKAWRCVMAMWNPWRGCHKYSEGCKFCYIHKGDAKRGVDTNQIVKLSGFNAPIARDKKGEYKIKSGQTVYLCFSTDFLIEEADEWREECWRMIKERPDLMFLFLTKRIERFMECIPKDWNDGYNNVTVGCTVENQDRADFRLSQFVHLPIKHKNIICQPLIQSLDIEKYLESIELVVVGGESDRNARPLEYDWVKSIRQQCINKKVHFEFRQCGTHFIKDNKEYTLNTRDLTSQARKANIDY